MTPQEQLRKTENGDCLRSVIASLLDYQINEVPDFTAEDSGGQAWWIELQLWLSERGFFFLEVRLGGKAADNSGELKDVFTVWNPLPFAAIGMFIGFTDKGIRHIIIGTCEGDRFNPQFDPFPECGGIKSVEAVAFLVPRDPSLQLRMGKALEDIRTMIIRNESSKTKVLKVINKVLDGTESHAPAPSSIIVPGKF